MKMNEINEIFKQFRQGNGEWHQFINSIKITNIHGWNGQTMEFHFPVVAVVGENGIGKSTFLKAAVCAYNNTTGKDFYPSKMFMNTQWDKEAMEGAIIEYNVRVGDSIRNLKWKRTKEWGYTPKKNKPKRYVSFWDISRTVPLDATAGYAKVALSNSEEAGTNLVLDKESLDGLSYVLGQRYINARFTKTDADQTRDVGLLTKSYGEISQFHQGAGEDSVLDMFKAFQSIPEQSLLVIDEVENSLHPQAQRRFVKYLLSLSRRKKIQILLSTHSPFVLEELPPIARIMLVPLSDQKQIIDSVSTNFALSSIDAETHPDLYIHVEDEEAKGLVWEILKIGTDRYDELSKRISILVVGSCSVVDTLNEYARTKKLPYKSVSIVDGDKKSERPYCLSLPGDNPPEKMVFEDLQHRSWHNLENRFGIGAGSLYKILDDAMLERDHHLWTEYVGDKIKKSKDTVWSIMSSEWCKQVYPTLNDTNMLEGILTALDQDSQNE